MSLNPFHTDPAIPERLARQDGEALREAAIAALIPGRVIPAADVDRIVSDHSLAGPEDLMCHLVQAARTWAQPPISDFFVGTVGRDTTGDLILGCNLEFPGTTLAFTVHGEGFVITRAFQLGRTITTLALGEAHPCAHCRQYISEFAAVRDMVLIDRIGQRLTMAQLYPWPFDPGYLGKAGAVPGALSFPGLTPAALIPESLLSAGQGAWTPYSCCPGAVLLTLTDGTEITGAAIESVSFNPTIQPIQSALIALLAHDRTPSEIATATLGTVKGGAVDYTAPTTELLTRIVPQVPLTTIGWSP
ncbi:MAG: cytidine deaminase [Rhodobacterales bacterium]|nr:cytidine deaminase [Rhodobacterales bacterium]